MLTLVFSICTFGKKGTLMWCQSEATEVVLYHSVHTRAHTQLLDKRWIDAVWETSSKWFQVVLCWPWQDVGMQAGMTHFLMCYHGNGRNANQRAIGHFVSFAVFESFKGSLEHSFTFYISCSSKNKIFMYVCFYVQDIGWPVCFQALTIYPFPPHVKVLISCPLENTFVHLCESEKRTRSVLICFFLDFFISNKGHISFGIHTSIHLLQPRVL